MSQCLYVAVDDLVPAEHLQQVVEHETEQPGEETDEENDFIDQELIVELEAEVLVGLTDERSSSLGNISLSEAAKVHEHGAGDGEPDSHGV